VKTPACSPLQSAGHWLDSYTISILKHNIALSHVSRYVNLIVPTIRRSQFNLSWEI